MQNNKEKNLFIEMSVPPEKPKRDLRTLTGKQPLSGGKLDGSAGNNRAGYC